MDLYTGRLNYIFRKYMDIVGYGEYYLKDLLQLVLVSILIVQTKYTV